MALDPKPTGRPQVIIEEHIFSAPITFQVLPKTLVGNIKIGDTTPSVLNLQHWVAKNTGAVTITDFKDGGNQQHLYILGDGQTTLQHGTNIFLSAGANLLLAVNRVYQLVMISGKWYQL